MSVLNVGFTCDMRGPSGAFSLGRADLSRFTSDHLAWSFLSDHQRELQRDDIEGFDAIVVFGSVVSTSTLDATNRLLLVVRFGVGLDTVDVEACTRRGVARPTA